MKPGLMAVVVWAMIGAGAAEADPALGVWKTEPDRKALTSHIEIKRCGPHLCGWIIAAFDAAGRKVSTPNVGRRLFWDLSVEGNGRYGGGRVYVPLLDFTAAASMTLQGNTLRVRGCKGPVCDGQVWRRVR